MEYERYRSLSTPSAPATNVANVNGSVSTSTKTLPAVESRETYDFVVPHFHLRVNQGEVFNNPYLSVYTVRQFSETQHLRTEHRSNGSVTYFEDYTRSNWNLPDLLGQATPVVLDTTEAARNAQINALANVNNTDVDALAFWGEWHKTKALHRDLGNALLGLFTEGAKASVRKAKFVKTVLYDEYGRPLLNKKGQPLYRYLHSPGEITYSGRSRASRISNVYLAGRYGVMPLLKDLEDAVRFLQRRFHPRFTARGNVSVQGQSSVVKTLTAGNFGSWDVTVTQTLTVDLRYGILYETDPVTRALAQLGVTRPLSSAWELAPWSFVGDWFLGVGRYLDAIQPAGLTKTLSAWSSTRETVVTTAVPTAYRPATGTSSSDTWLWSLNGSCLVQTVTKRRDPWVPTIPSHPGLGSGFNAIRSGDFAALMLQKIKAKF